MKIAFIVPSLASKGPTLVCLDIIKNIIAHVEECHVYYFDDVVELNFPCKTTKISFFSNLNLEKYDICHTHMFRPDVYVWLNGLVRRKEFKTVSTIHTAIYHDLRFAYSNIKSLILPPLWKFSWNHFDQIVVLTNFAKSYYKDLKPNVVVVPNGRMISESPIDFTDIDLINGLKKKFKIIGTVASFDDRKGLDQVVRALKTLEDYVFLIVGDGQKIVKDKLIELAKSLNVENRVVFLGKRPDGDRYIPYFDIFVIPSISEGFPLALLEAAAHRATIICSNIDVFKESFSEEDVVFFNLFDTVSLVRAVHSAEENCTTLKENVHKAFTRSYTPEIMGINYLKLYKNLLK